MQRRQDRKTKVIKMFQSKWTDEKLYWIVAFLISIGWSMDYFIFVEKRACKLRMTQSGEI